MDEQMGRFVGGLVGWWVGAWVDARQIDREMAGKAGG